MERSRLAPLVTSLVVALFAVGPVACGGEDESGDQASTGERTEQAFLEAMVPHHESAVEMAEMAQRRAEHRQIRQLAETITRTQTDEIRQIERLHKRLFASELRPDPTAHDQLGLSAEEAGMHEDMTTTLERAKPFDRAFIDAMVPHHRGAIRMARVALGKAEDRELRRLARSIITTQSDEIVDMNAWRKRWYGAATPKKAGGGHEMDRGEGSGSKMENEGETH